MLKLAAEHTVEKVQLTLQGQLAVAGKWRATQVREALVPEAGKVIELAGPTPSLHVYQGSITFVLGLSLQFGGDAQLLVHRDDFLDGPTDSDWLDWINIWSTRRPSLKPEYRGNA